MSCWSTLGIDPTDDLVVIKRAYAAKLKVTRPDDDAAAYQRLRDDYQTALTAAKKSVAAIIADGPVQAECSDIPASSGKAAAAPPPAAFDAGQLIAEVMKRWVSDDGDELIAYWPELEHELYRIPLTAALETSMDMAAMVVANPSLPAYFVQFLSAHFSWEEPGLLESNLGKPRAQALRERLRNIAFEIKAYDVRKEQLHLYRKRIHEAEQDRQAALRSRYQNVTASSRLMETASPFVQWLHAWLAGPSLRTEWNGMSDADRAELGIDAGLRQRADSILRRVALARCALVACIAAVVLLLHVLYGAGWPAWRTLCLLALFCFLYLPQVGTSLEKWRAAAPSWRVLKGYLDENALKGFDTRPGSVLFCFIAAMVGLVWTAKHPDANPPLSTTLWILGPLLLAWLTVPIDEAPSLRVLPMMGAFCFVTTLGLWTGHPLKTLAVAAIWHSLIYSTRVPLGKNVVGTMWLVVLPLILFRDDDVTVPLLSFGVPWLLYEMACRRSPAYVAACLAVSILALQSVEPALFAIGTGTIAVFFMLGSAALQRGAKFLVPQTARSAR